jgi:3'-phosphoadenosine 5'-phosphosulfate sulfotransferase (PAPS reductase)/FAD synthetase
MAPFRRNKMKTPSGSVSKERHILNMSGGKDSTALAVLMRRQNPDLEIEYVFCDTLKELKETYEYLNRIEAYLGKKIVRLNAEGGFDHWHKVFNGYLPSPQMRWCTKMLKLKPFEAYVGNDPVISYVGIRADEDRLGYVSTKPNIRAVFPLRDAGVDYDGVIKLLEESGLGLPPYTKWGRTHSGCFFCFFQQPIEWIRLLENHPDQFEEAMAYEKISSEAGKTFTWNQGMPLSEMKKPEVMAGIKQRHEERKQRLRKNRGDRKLVETLGGQEEEEQESQACLICQK